MRANPLAFALWVHLSDALDSDDATSVKVRSTAEYLGAKPDKLRAALRWLCAHHWLVLVGVNAHGTPSYVLHPSKGDRQGPLLVITTLSRAAA